MKSLNLKGILLGIALLFLAILSSALVFCAKRLNDEPSEPVTLNRVP